MRLIWRCQCCVLWTLTALLINISQAPCFTVWPSNKEIINKINKHKKTKPTPKSWVVSSWWFWWWMVTFWACCQQLQVVWIREPLYLGLRPLAHSGKAILLPIIRRHNPQGHWVGLPCLFWHSSRFNATEVQASSISLCWNTERLSSTKCQHSQIVQYNAMNSAESYKLASGYQARIQFQHWLKNEKYFAAKFRYSRK